MSAVFCIKCRQPVKNVPSWFGRTQAKFVCEECNHRNADDVEAVINSIRSKVQEEMARDPMLISDSDSSTDECAEEGENLSDETDDEAA